MIWISETCENASLQPENALKNVLIKKLVSNLISSTTKNLDCPNRVIFQKKTKEKHHHPLKWRETPCRSCEAGAPNPNKSTIGSPWRCNTIPAEFPPRVPRWRRRCRRSSAKLLRPFYGVFDMGKSHGNYQMGTIFLGGAGGWGSNGKNKVPSIQSHDNSFESIMSQHHASALIFS